MAMVECFEGLTGSYIMDTYQPLISVLIPSYNHQDFIRQTVESIRCQQYRNIEIVVVDDCSSDNSRSVLEKLSEEAGTPIRLYFNESNQGIARTINTLLGHAQGELVALMASDDVFGESRFEAQLRLFAGNPELKIAYANGRVLKNGEPGKRLHGAEVMALLQEDAEYIQRYLYTHVSPLFLQAALIKRSFLQEAGGCDETALVDDWLLNVRLFSAMNSKSEYRYVDEDVVFYRHHEGNVHRDYGRQSRLKLEFIERFTPAHLKSEGFANIHYDLARLALKNGLRQEALKHFMASQKAQFSVKRMKFVTKFLRRL